MNVCFSRSSVDRCPTSWPILPLTFAHVARRQQAPKDLTGIRQRGGTYQVRLFGGHDPVTGKQVMLAPAARRNDRLQYPYRHMPKAARVLAALKRDGWAETRRRGSHRVLAKDDRQRIWAYHEGVDLGGPAMARIAKDYGYTLAELRKL